jgi:hypothetical protein|tara:strand:+ start:149 stop:547 length:399 start_codon:yes stop_codon:yes gene_type:complete
MTKYNFDAWKLDGCVRVMRWNFGFVLMYLDYLVTLPVYIITSSLFSCGKETDLVLFNKYMTDAGKPIMVENCHWGRVAPAKPDRSLPPAQGCPWNFYRSSGDVRASYASVLGNLATVEPLRKVHSSLSVPSK